MQYACSWIAARILPQIHVPRCWNVTHVQFGKLLSWRAQESSRMRLERFKCCWNVIRMFRTQLEWSWNAVGIHFLLECSWKVLSMSKTFQPPTRMDQNSWNVAGMQLEVLERSWNIQEWTKNFHSNCIPVHSSPSVIGVLHEKGLDRAQMLCWSPLPQRYLFSSI